MKTRLMIMAGLALIDVIVFLLLKHEHKKRKEAERAAEDAAYNANILTKAQKIKQEARNESDKKINDVRSASSDRDKFNAIMHGLCNGKNTS